jgi:hypothetical protein
MCITSVYNDVACRDEYGKLFDFVTTKKLRVKNIGGKLVCMLFSYKGFGSKDFGFRIL